MVVEKVAPNSPTSATQVSIFLSPMDVHINRSPIGGKIEDVLYKCGAFKVASRTIAAKATEQNVITSAKEDIRLGTRQMAGFPPRRIVFWKAPGDTVAI